MFGELLAILEVELILTAFLDWASCRVAVFRGIVKDGRAELLVNQNGCFIFRHTSFQGGLKALIDHLLTGGDLRSLLCRQRAMVTEHLDERPAMVEGHDV